MAKDKIFVELVTKGDKKATQSIKNLGIAVGIASAAIAGIIKVGGDLVKAYEQQEQAESKLEAAIRATGGAVGISKDEMIKMASALQDQTTLGDEAIITAQGLMTTFTQIGKEVFPEAIERAADMSIMFGQDLSQSAIQLGTALNDPIAGIGRLKRIGISFTDDQKASIKTFMDQNDIMSAQKVILDELKAEFGGVAKAAGETATGALKQLGNAWNDLKQIGGETVAEGLKPIAKWLTNVMQEAVEASKAMKGFKISIEDINEETDLSKAEKNVELLTAAWKSSEKHLDNMTKAYEKQGAGFYNVNKLAMESAQKNLELDAQKVYLARQIVKGIKAEKQAILDGNEALAEKGKKETEANEALLEYLDKVEEAYARTPEGQKKALEASIAYWEGMLESAVYTEDEVLAILDMLYKKQEESSKEATEVAKSGMEAWLETQEQRQKEKEKELDFFNTVDREKTETEKKGSEERIKITEEELDAKIELFEEHMSNIQTIVDSIIDIFQHMSDSRLITLQNEMEEALEIETEKYEKELELLEEQLETRQEALQSAYDDQLTNLKEQLEQGVITQEEYDAKKKELDDKLTEDKETNEQWLVDQKKVAEEAKLALEEEYDKKKRKILHDEAVLKKIATLFEIGMNTAAAFTKALANPILAAAILALGIVQAGIVAATPIPSFAQGGEFETSGPQKILVGDNIGGRERVKITPLNGSSEVNRGDIFQIFINDKMVWDSVTRGTANGNIKIKRRALIA